MPDGTLEKIEQMVKAQAAYMENLHELLLMIHMRLEAIEELVRKQGNGQ